MQHNAPRCLTIIALVTDHDASNDPQDVIIVLQDRQSDFHQPSKQVVRIAPGRSGTAAIDSLFARTDDGKFGLIWT